MDRNHLCFRVQTHKSQENNKSREDKIKDIVDYLCQVNIAIQEFEPAMIMQLDETPSHWQKPPKQENKEFSIRLRD